MKAKVDVAAVAPIEILAIGGVLRRPYVEVLDPDGKRATLHAGDTLNVNVNLDFAKDC